MCLRFRSILACFALVTCVSTTTPAAEPDRIAAAQRDVEIAQLELRRYLNVEYPSQRDHLETQLTLAAAEIAIQEDLVREYERMSRGKTSRPFLVTLSDARIALLGAQLSYQRHCDALSRLKKFHGDQCRLLELRLEAAHARLAALVKAGKR